MKISDLTKEHEELFFLCLEDWSDEAKESGRHRACWFAKMRERGLRAKIALDDKGVVGGMIQYLPIEQSFVDGEGLYFIPCIWVHGHKKGRGDFRGHGMGAELLKAAEEDALQLGAKGMAAWGLLLPFWMKAGWFKKHGYRQAGRNGISALVWKPFARDAKPPQWIQPVKKPPLLPGKVAVTSLIHGWCMAMNLGHERARRAVAEFGDKAVYTAVDTSEKDAVREWGYADALFIDGKPMPLGPPPSYEKIRKRVAARVKKLPATG